MARDVSVNDLGSLSRDELLYLDSRGRLTPAQRKKHLGLGREQTVGNMDEAVSPENYMPPGENTGDVGPTSQAELDAQAAADDSGEELAYDEMSNDDLRDELRERGLSTGGNKDELIARLEEDDES